MKTIQIDIYGKPVEKDKEEVMNIVIKYFFNGQEINFNKDKYIFSPIDPGNPMYV